jgi:hypothetical protein
MHLASNLEMSLLLYRISQDPSTTEMPLDLWNALDLVVPGVPKKMTYLIWMLKNINISCTWS